MQLNTLYGGEVLSPPIAALCAVTPPLVTLIIMLALFIDCEVEEFTV